MSALAKKMGFVVHPASDGGQAAKSAPINGDKQYSKHAIQFTREPRQALATLSAVFKVMQKRSGVGVSSTAAGKSSSFKPAVGTMGTRVSHQETAKLRSVASNRIAERARSGKMRHLMVWSS